jgi:hypothetical protein
VSTTTLGGTVASTTAAATYTTSSFTPAVGDLLIGWFGITGNTGAWAPSDSASGSWTKIRRQVKSASADFLELWVRNSLITSATAMTASFALTGASPTGGIIVIHRISGMTKTGSAAVLQQTGSDNQVSVTPSPALAAATQAANTGQIGFLVTNTVNTTTFTSFTLDGNVNYATPSTQLRTFHDDASPPQTATGNASVGVQFAIIYVELDTSTGGLSATVAQVTETDTATDLGASKSLAVGQVSETDTAPAMTSLKTVAVGQVSETDTATGVGSAKSVAVDQVSETDTANVISTGGVKNIAVAMVSETDTAAGITSIKTLAVAMVTETDTATGMTPIKALAVSQVVETDTASVMTWAKFMAIAQALETDSAMTISPPAPAATAPLLNMLRVGT